MSKTSRFTGKSRTRIEDGGSGIKNRGSGIKDRLRNLEKKVNKQIVNRGDVGRRLTINFTKHNPARCTEHKI